MILFFNNFDTDKKYDLLLIILKISLRKVLKKDWDFILNLRNNEKYRDFFYNQDKITKSDHYAYMEKQKLNPKFVNWIISYGSNNVGYLRILDNDVSIMLDDKFRNKGIGTTALGLMEIEAKKMGISKLVGKVMVHNKSSKKIFKKNNYKFKMYWFEKDI